MKRQRRSNRRGVALIMVLGALTVLTVMLADFQDETSAELGSALSARDSLRAEYAARSALNLGRLLIASEPTIRKALAPLLMLIGGGAPPQIPVWEFADQVLGAFNDQSGTARFAALAGVDTTKGKNLGIEGAGFDIEIVDEESKININMGAKQDTTTPLVLQAELIGLMRGAQYDAMFSGRDGDGQYSDRQTVCGAIVDWVDADQQKTACDFSTVGSGSTGPEDSFYQMLEPPYYRKNAPMDSLDELHMVRGVSDDFWATFVEPEAGDDKKRNVTVWGSGKINVNTANAFTMLSIICAGSTTAKVCSDPIEAAKFLAAAELIRTLTAGAPIFGSPKVFIATMAQQTPVGVMLQMIGLSPIQFNSPDVAMKAITTESKVFSIVATGYVKSGKRETRHKIHAVVDMRGAPTPQNLIAKQLSEAAGGLGGGVGALLGGAPNPAATTGIDPTQPIPGMPPGTTADADLGFLIPDPAGRVIYFRMD
jgi:general secretion pathway protein K